MLFLERKSIKKNFIAALQAAATPNIPHGNDTVLYVEESYKKGRHAARRVFLVRAKGFEPPTYWFVASHSIQLSYARIPQRGVPLDSLVIIAQPISDCKRNFPLFYFLFYSPIRKTNRYRADTSEA